jgi:hypothetical protein
MRAEEETTRRASEEGIDEGGGEEKSELYLAGPFYRSFLSSFLLCSLRNLGKGKGSFKTLQRSRDSPPIRRGTRLTAHTPCFPNCQSVQSSKPH